jgi:hypothetical protein
MEQASSNVLHGAIGQKRRAVTLLSCLLLAAGLSVTVLAGPAGADTATYSSASIGTSGDTATFSQGGPWTMAWSYNCSNYGSPGNFVVTVNNSASDLGANELGTGGSGTDYYYDTGSFSLSIISECDWSITVSPNSAGPSGTPVTITSGQIGVTGNSAAFAVGGPWTMAWNYDCSAFGSPGNFAVIINQPPGDTAYDVGPNELGMSGNGADSYSDTGKFSLEVISECAWSITVSSSGSAPPPPPAPPATTGMASTPDGGGYWIVSANGGVVTRGNAAGYGSMAGQPLNAPISHIVSTPDGKGYWLVAADGGTFSFGDAHFFGSMGGQHLNAPVVDLAPTPDGGGYWLVASDGGIFSFGDAAFHGSMGSQHLNKPVVGISADTATGGYWEVATDGGIFAFGAPFFGSTGAIHLNKPVNGMTSTSDGLGYWFVASDGGIFAFGDAQFHGSMGGTPLNAPVVGMATDYATGGYWLVASDGGIFSFNAPFYGAA